jgi:hypothetical protein
LWSGIGNEAPHQRLVVKLKELEDIRDGLRANKRAKTDVIVADLLTEDGYGTDDEWFDAICSVMETSNFMDRFVKDTILKRRSSPKNRRIANLV